MKKVTYVGGNTKGHFSCKWNRAAKLNVAFPELEKKLLSIAKRGKASNSDMYRSAVATLLMMYTGIRVGNERSAEGYVSKRKEKNGATVQTFGLTTVTKQHLKKNLLVFTGKREIAQRLEVPKCIQKDLKYIAEYSEVTLFDLSHYEFTKFIKKYVGKGFMPKDFRTVVANRLAVSYIDSLPAYSTKKEYKAQVKGLCEYVSMYLGNTPAMAKKAYINPELLNF